MAAAGDQLTVLDAAARQVVVLRSVSAPEWSWRLGTIPNAEGLCVAGDTVFVIGLHDGRLIHSYSIAKRQHLSDYGEAFVGGDELTAALISRGAVGCDTRHLFLASDWTGRVRSYSFHGTLLWETTLEGYKKIEVTSDGRVYRTRAPEAGFHRTLSVAPLGEGLVLVQLELIPRAFSASSAHHRTLLGVVLRTETGEEVARMPMRQELLAGDITGRRLLFQGSATPGQIILAQATVPRRR
jgi:hypothetical protein